MALVATVPAAFAKTPTMVSSFRTATTSGVGNIVSGEQIGSGDSAIFVYEVRYGAKLAKQVRLCSGRSLRVGDPVLFAIGNPPPKHPACPNDTQYIPAESTSTYVLSGLKDAYSGRLAFRVTYPQTVTLGCEMPLTTVLKSVSRDGKPVEEFGPLDTTGEYFFWGDFLGCLKSK